MVWTLEMQGPEEFFWSIGKKEKYYLVFRPIIILSTRNQRNRICRSRILHCIPLSVYLFVFVSLSIVDYSSFGRMTLPRVVGLICTSGLYKMQEAPTPDTKAAATPMVTING
mmetsp:Transcript_15039/g.37889  ORF Transcript_15039/g.37889 Transcript_15039/m.37889 type:complete len:112 (+) Transcript_15039:39-374(+)